MNTENENDYILEDENNKKNENKVTPNGSAGALGGYLLAVGTFFASCFSRLPLLALVIMTAIASPIYTVTAIVSFVLSIVIPPLIGLVPFACFTVAEIFLAVICVVLCAVTLAKAITVLVQNKRIYEDYKKSNTVLSIISIVVSALGLAGVSIGAILNIVDMIFAIF